MPFETAILALVLCIGTTQQSLARQNGPAADPAPAAAPAPQLPAPVDRFTLKFDPALQTTPYSGRVYVVLAKGMSGRQPRMMMSDWFRGAQVLALDVASAASDGEISINSPALSYPAKFADIPPGMYTVQAVARRNPDSPTPGRGAGDLYSDPKPVNFGKAGNGDGGGAGSVTLMLNHAVSPREFKETDEAKLVEMVSPSLSAFAGREVKIRAGVHLPKEWKDAPERPYPTIYFFGGFGSDHFSIFRAGASFGAKAPGAVIVVPDPLCFRGYCGFADSANNGPWGKALTEELIPEIEKRYHCGGEAGKRFVTGISSGGWASLWLQVVYPDFFGGCWSHCPDPVSFDDFQRINLYAKDANMFRDGEGKRRPLARDGDEVKLWYDDFVHQETVIGPGGQIHSFEAVFSPRGADGAPVPLFDHETGAVNTEVARQWEKYDIRQLLERDWATLGPKLAGKVHVFAGGADNFYLETAVEKLGATLKELGSDAEVLVVPGMVHSIHTEGMESMYKAVEQAGK